MLAAAGLDRRQVYLTNAVKSFNWTLSGSRRLHKKPGAHELTTWHLFAVQRAPERQSREQMKVELIEDLTLARQTLRQG